MKESMLRPVRVEAGLGNPPSEYINNDPESANFIIKHGLHFNVEKPHEFIHKIKNIIETQQRNQDRAVFGKGMYRVRPSFQHLAIGEVEISRLSYAQKTKKLIEFKNAGMNDMHDATSPDQEDSLDEEQTSSMSISAKESKITTVPLPILEAMFEKASNLLVSKGSVIPKPGADNGSFTVAGTLNKVHSVTPGKGGCLSCDRTCINHATKVCEHVLAVAQLRGSLGEFLAWFKRRKQPAMMDMVEQRGPKNAGRKPSKRKRSNAKKQSVNEYTDLLGGSDDQSEDLSGGQQPPARAARNVRQHSTGFSSNPVVPTTLSHSDTTQVNTFHHQQRASAPSFAKNGMSQVSPLSRYPSMVTCGIPQTGYGYHVQATPSSATLPDGVSTAGTVHNLINPQQLASVPNFYLKWVQGTRVSRCYGCNGIIQNPPLHRPDDLIVFCRDIREYRDRFSGQLQRSASAQNVHFHLRNECILMKYPGFSVEFLKIGPEFIPYLQQEHLRHLAVNFGWTFNC